MGEASLLTLTHDGFETETDTYRSVGNGWPLIMSSLKTLLETGERLEVRDSEPEAAPA